MLFLHAFMLARIDLQPGLGRSVGKAGMEGKAFCCRPSWDGAEGKMGDGQYLIPVLCVHLLGGLHLVIPAALGGVTGVLSNQTL